MITLDAAQVQFIEGGNTLWVQSESGTVLRIKCTGKIELGRGCVNSIPHADMMVEGNIHICVPDDFDAHTEPTGKVVWHGE